MITRVMDAVVFITNVFSHAGKKSKEDSLFTAAENEYIAARFAEVIKDSNRCLDKVKELISPKWNINEEEKMNQLQQMYEKTKVYEGIAEDFERGFNRLSELRRKRLTDLTEVQRLFKERPIQKEKNEQS